MSTLLLLLIAAVVCIVPSSYGQTCPGCIRTPGCLYGHYELLSDRTKFGSPVTSLDFSLTPGYRCKITFNLQKDNPQRALDGLVRPRPRPRPKPTPNAKHLKQPKQPKQPKPTQPKPKHPKPKQPEPTPEQPKHMPTTEQPKHMPTPTATPLTTLSPGNQWARFSALYGIVVDPKARAQWLVLYSVDPIPAAFKADFEAYSDPEFTLKTLIVFENNNHNMNITTMFWKEGTTTDYQFAYLPRPEY